MVRKNFFFINNNQDHLGFTLLELMIAVAIIALLAAVGIPAYQKYIQKSKLSEGYTMLRKMFDGAVLESAKIAVQEYDGGVLQECIETRRFGEFASFILISGVENYVPPQNGIKSPIYFKQASKTFGFTKSGDCTVWAENTNLGFFGFSVDNNANDSATVEARHFAYSNRADLNLFMVLMGEGKNVAYNIDDSVSVNSLWAFADLDGDYTTPDPSLGQNITNVGLRSTELTYLMRGIYFDTVTNQVVGTDGIYAENLGE